MWPRSTEPVQTCVPQPRLTAMFDPNITGHYPSTNSAFWEHVLERYSRFNPLMVIPKTTLVGPPL